MASAGQRSHVVDLAHLMTAHERQVHYLQRRPMQSRYLTERTLRLELEHGGELSMDCSEYVSLLCRLVGLHTPWVHDGQGNTETILATLPHYHDAKIARPGALVVFEPTRALSQQHVAIVIAAGKDPLLSSHGMERGPLNVRLSAEAAYHGGSYTFCSIAHL